MNCKIDANIVSKLKDCFDMKCKSEADVVIKQIYDKVCRAALIGKDNVRLYVSGKNDKKIIDEFVSKGFKAEVKEGNVVIKWD